jgi:hypothetical protein
LPATTLSAAEKLQQIINIYVIFRGNCFCETQGWIQGMSTLNANETGIVSEKFLTLWIRKVNEAESASLAGYLVCCQKYTKLSAQDEVLQPARKCVVPFMTVTSFTVPNWEKKSCLEHAHV